MLHAVITTIQRPTPSVYGLVSRLSECGARLIVAGDSKGPDSFEAPDDRPWPVEFLSLADQKSSGFRLADHLPIRHYARKNIAYLQAMRNGAACIYETDDDNAPNGAWSPRSETMVPGLAVDSQSDGWVNVYRCFSDDLIWPRGLPLDEIRKPLPEVMPLDSPVRAPIQQGLVNGSADVDAIWRFVMDREFFFRDGPSVMIPQGIWCPFNTQSTWWWPVAYPLLYIPSHCSFRMCDIWKSFIAQRCLWELGLGIVFHAPEVYQERNPHDLMRDFRDEIPGYDRNRELCTILGGLSLLPGEGEVCGNLMRCYEALISGGFFPDAERELLLSWVEDYGTVAPRSS